MRIVLASDWFLPRLGGLELHVRDLAGRLRAAGHEVHVLTTTPADPDRQGRLQTGDPGLPEGVEVHRLDVPLLPGSGLGVSVRLPRMAGEVLDALRPRLVHVHAGMVPPLALAAARAAHLRGVPVVTTFHSVLGPARHPWRLADRLVGWSTWSAVLAGVGPRVAEEMAGVTGRSVRVLPNGIDTAAWPDPGGAHEGRRRDGTGEGPSLGARDGAGRPDDSRDPELRVVTVMRLQRRKRGAALLNAVAAASEALGPAARLTLDVVGEGPRRRALEARARRLGIADRVRFLGYVDRAALPRILADADVFATAAVLESFGLSVVEARAAGLPVVARQDSGVAVHVRDGREGLLAADDAGLADALARLAREPGLRHTLARHNRATPPPYDWPGVLAAHFEAYGDALAGGEDGSDQSGIADDASHGDDGARRADAVREDDASREDGASGAIDASREDHPPPHGNTGEAAVDGVAARR